MLLGYLGFQVDPGHRQQQFDYLLSAHRTGQVQSGPAVIVTLIGQCGRTIVVTVGQGIADREDVTLIRQKR